MVQGTDDLILLVIQITIMDPGFFIIALLSTIGRCWVLAEVCAL